jgi:hypothetical protein
VICDVLLSASLMILLSSSLILSVVWSWVANGSGREASEPVVIVVLPVLIYPMVGDL